jgi:hypothetical protein
MKWLFNWIIAPLIFGVFINVGIYFIVNLLGVEYTWGIVVFSHIIVILTMIGDVIAEVLNEL